MPKIVKHTVSDTGDQPTPEEYIISAGMPSLTLIFFMCFIALIEHRNVEWYDISFIYNQHCVVFSAPNHRSWIFADPHCPDLYREGYLPDHLIHLQRRITSIQYSACLPLSSGFTFNGLSASSVLTFPQNLQRWLLLTDLSRHYHWTEGSYSI
ncbi:MAG: hypothetical protein IPO25_22810 [Saprospiraceae bacterium]|nr:hypothetical protein [Saprospiraceae bacterium]